MLTEDEKNEINSIVYNAVKTALTTKEQEDDNIFITREEAARILHVHPSTLWRRAKANYPPLPLKNGAKVLYRKADFVRIGKKV